MLRRILITALLCLVCQTAQAQYYATVPDLIEGTYSGASSTVDRRSIEIYQHIKNFAADLDDGKEYEIISFTYYYHYVNSNRLMYNQSHGNLLLEKSSSGYCIVSQCPVIHSPNQSVITINYLAPNRTLVYKNRYFYTYSQVRDYYLKFNAILDASPTSRESYLAKYGDIAEDVFSVSKISSRRNVSDLTRDTDGGGVPDYAEFTCGYWSTNHNDASDDFFCFCDPCCACRCTCRFYCPKFCDGTTHSETGCACHDGSWVDPTDPIDPIDPIDPQPGLSENAPALLRGLLFAICMFCGTGFFGSFIDSLEKGSF